MLLSVFTNILDQPGAVDDFDIVGQADDEATHTAIVGHEGIEKPMGAIDLVDLGLSHGILLDEEAVGHDAHAETDTVAVETGHAERIDKAAAMGMAELP